MHRVYKHVCLLALLVLLLPGPVRATAIVWGGIQNAGGWVGSGASGSDEQGDDFQQDQTQLMTLGSQTSSTSDRFGDWAYSELTIGEHTVSGIVNSGVPTDFPHFGQAQGFANGGVQGDFTVEGGSGQVVIPLHAEGVFEVDGWGDGAGYWYSTISDDQDNQIWMGLQQFSLATGPFQTVTPIVLDLEEGRTYYYNLEISVNASSTEPSESGPGSRRFDALDESAGHGAVTAWFADPNTAPVPEPATALLLGPVLAGLWLARRRRRSV